MTLYTLDIQVTLKEQTVFASGHQAGNLVLTHDYIPGTALRGAFVQRFLNEKGKSVSDPEFRQWFLSDAVRFENLYPSSGGQEQALVSTPIPLATLTCKDYPGLNVQDFSAEQHSFTDFLLQEMRGECEDGVIVDYEGRSSRPCRAPLTNREGFYYADGKGDYYHVESRKLILDDQVFLT